jgi:hypothetical protein
MRFSDMNPGAYWASLITSSMAYVEGYMGLEMSPFSASSAYDTPFLLMHGAEFKTKWEIL